MPANEKLKQDVLKDVELSDSKMTMDQLFKLILRLNLPDFLNIFPFSLAVQLDMSNPHFLESETITDLQGKKNLIPDIIVQLRTKSGIPEIILFHIEVQSRKFKNFAERMFRYYKALQNRYGYPIIPIAILIDNKTGGIKICTYEEKALDLVVVRFQYYEISLASLDASEYMSKESPLAVALSAFMNRGGMSKLDQKIECTKKLAKLCKDETDFGIFMVSIDTYIPLDSEDEMRYRSVIEKEKEQPEMELLTRWGRDIKEEGRVLGREEGKVVGREEGKVVGREEGKVVGREEGKVVGREEGKVLGREEGKVLGREEGREEGKEIGARELLLSIGEHRFGPPSKSVIARIYKIRDLQKLKELAVAMLNSTSWADIH